MKILWYDFVFTYIESKDHLQPNINVIPATLGIKIQANYDVYIKIRK